MTVDQKRKSNQNTTQPVKKVRQITDFFKAKEPKVQTEEEIETEPSTPQQVEPLETYEDLSDTFDYTQLSQFKQTFASKLTPEQKQLLHLELATLEDTWFESLSTELTKPYFLNLKKYLQTQFKNKEIFPPKQDIYSWSRLTPLSTVKVIILGQDPYHNNNQAHGLAFSVRHPTVPPPSLKNIYKAIQIEYPNFEIPNGKVHSQAGDLTQWAKQGVLMLNACLTVEAHKANSHAKQGWEQFTSAVLRVVIENTQNNLILLLWGTPAQNRIKGLKLNEERIKIISCVHPSPLSARRGFFEARCFIGCNEMLLEMGEEPIEWGLLKGNTVLTGDDKK
ncbi:hypothetical protein WICPIJ_001754 [Wickerhamomyces pijperi]|uniref:Uracil-DNA glycosylase n=1 Tax=Wickerhamomyces pijperi TaxID=599730 RepID=A0A9P8TQF4_WICPI|nr:hypothetical protein WICPIJ_001754 [Wickerhamomyces pijperi]